MMSRSMLIVHGNAYAALKVGEPMASRARAVGRVASLIFLLAFVAGGFWLRSMGGYEIVGGIDQSGPSDPTRKTVIIAAGAWRENFFTWPRVWAAPPVAAPAAGGGNLSLLTPPTRPPLPPPSSRP